MQQNNSLVNGAGMWFSRKTECAQVTCSGHDRNKRQSEALKGTENCVLPFSAARPLGVPVLRSCRPAGRVLAGRRKGEWGQSEQRVCGAGREGLPSNKMALITSDL